MDRNPLAVSRPSVLQGPFRSSNTGLNDHIISTISKCQETAYNHLLLTSLSTVQQQSRMWDQRLQLHAGELSQAFLKISDLKKLNKANISFKYTLDKREWNSSGVISVFLQRMEEGSSGVMSVFLKGQKMGSTETNQRRRIEMTPEPYPRRRFEISLVIYPRTCKGWKRQIPKICPYF